MDKKRTIILIAVLLAAIFIFTAMTTEKNNSSQQDREVTGYLRSIANSLDGIETQLEKLNSNSLYGISGELDEHNRHLSKIADELRYLRDAVR